MKKNKELQKEELEKIMFILGDLYHEYIKDNVKDWKDFYVEIEDIKVITDYMVFITNKISNKIYN